MCTFIPKGVCLVRIGVDSFQLEIWAWLVFELMMNCDLIYKIMIHKHAYLIGFIVYIIKIDLSVNKICHRVWWCEYYWHRMHYLTSLASVTTTCKMHIYA